jgi:hypothetical protein
MRHVLAASLTALAVSACGSAGSTATLKLMDKPTDDVSKVEITVASMQVHVVKPDDAKTQADPADASVDDATVATDGATYGWQSLAVNKKIDLLAHVGEGAAATLGDLPLPEGKITQIRLVLDTTAGNNVATKKDGSTCNLDTEKVAKKGIKINHVFKAFQSKENAKHEVVVDFDVDESLKEDKDTGCWKLEPKLKLVKVKTDGADQAL